MEAKPQLNDEILLRLNILINLLLDDQTSESQVSLASKVAKLSDLGVSPAEISRIINKPLNQITSILSKRKYQK